MANAKWRVWVWEYERGWGSKPDFHKDFDEQVDAEKFRDEFNSQNTETTVPDWYMAAHDPVLVDLNAE